jgi:hypothetical protein
MGLGPCTLNGVSYPTCTTAANLDVRRVLYQEKPTEARLLSSIDRHSDVGVSNYRALKLTVRRRGATGVSLNGNYTWAYCVGNATPLSPQFSSGYLNPADPSFDRGNCDSNRTHIGNVTVGIQTPEFGNATLRALASKWRVAGILNARSGGWLSVTTTQDIAATGITGQRVNQVSDDVYGPKTLTNYLQRSAFACRRPVPSATCAPTASGARVLVRSIWGCRSWSRSPSVRRWSFEWKRSTFSTTSTGATPRRTLIPGSSAE